MSAPPDVGTLPTAVWLASRMAFTSGVAVDAAKVGCVKVTPTAVPSATTLKITFLGSSRIEIRACQRWGSECHVNLSPLQDPARPAYDQASFTCDQTNVMMRPVALQCAGQRLIGFARGGG